MTHPHSPRASALRAFLFVLLCAIGHSQNLGLFESHSDIGTVLHPGAAAYDPASQSYTLTGSGENVWANSDAFQFVWKKMTGDLVLTADAAILGQGGDPHRKAMLMVRQSLDADSPYADIALHGVGLTSLQARAAKGAPTHEVQSYLSSPKRARLVKRGQYFYMYLSEKEGEEPAMAGGSMRVPIEGTFYVGIGVCAHNKDAVEKAVFSHVSLDTARPGKTQQYSTLETITVSSTDARVTLLSTERIEGPNWSRDGKTLIFTSGGKLMQVPETGGAATPLDTGFAARCTPAHGISPDGKSLAFSDESRDRGRSAVYVMPLQGGLPERVTQEAPSVFQAWMPDGKNLLIYGERKKTNGLFTIPVTGGAETFLGPGVAGEVTPDGKYIYFTSARSGSMQIWRMLADGTSPEQVTTGEFSAWFPHISPDGTQMAFMSTDKAAKLIARDREVAIRMMTLATKSVKDLARVVGGAGTLDAPSWSPDSRRLAFVSYQSVNR